ncbi:MAG: NADPH-dependent reductase, partial [Mucilaginibacter sp.]|nr:NADPH-dependent reductase [Mucilaginibacter sp.]
SYPAPLKNAVEYLVHEWAYKPSGMVGYSIGPFAGVRAIMNLKADMLALKNISLAEMVNIPQLNQFMDEEGNFTADERLNNNAKIMLDQLVRWTKGMKAIREDK